MGDLADPWGKQMEGPWQAETSDDQDLEADQEETGEANGCGWLSALSQPSKHIQTWQLSLSLREKGF